MTHGAPRRSTTSAETWHQLEQVMDAALDAAPAERARVVDERCRGDTALREAALAWLNACERGDRLFSEAPDLLGATAALYLDEQIASRAPQPGWHVGEWRLVSEIGRGGMGCVYLAERSDAELPLRAALKLLHGAVAVDPLAVRRFRDERRILAALTHPSIARLLDGGVTDDGLPWFAMEYVAGAPIDAWCDERALAVPARLRLACQVCDAVQHAHTRLVVHRDLKPANVLVSEAGEVKLLDFGIAKLLSADALSDPALTRPGMQPLTPAYAAPEQLRGEQPSTATDVYALGVLLHILLAGHLPFGDGREGAAMMERRIRDGAQRSSVAAARTRRDGEAMDDPALPTRIAAARASTPARLCRSLRGDLDAIVARAMHPDAARRYATADALAADLRRYLDGRPVLVRGDTTAYRLRKLVMRHPMGTVATAGAAVTVLAFATLAALQASRLSQQAEHLASERDKAAEVTAFLSGVLASADPYQPGGRVPTLREVLDRGAERAAVSLADRPEIRAHLLSAMAPAYFGLGDWARAGDLAEEAVALRRRTLSPGHPDLAAALVYLANVRLNQGRAVEAEAQAREALAIRRARPALAEPDTARILSTLGAALQRRGRLEEAEPALRALLAIERGRVPPSPLGVAQVARNLAHVLRDRRAFADAVPLYAEAYALHRALYGDEHPESANSAVNLGNAHFLAGDLARAEPLLRRGVETKRRLLGVEHKDVAGDQATLARVLAARGAHEEAAALRQEALRVLGRVHSPEH